jgi:hypothetical protein
VNVGAGAPRKSVEEVVNEFGLQIAYETRTNFRVNDNGSASAEVDGSNAERFVHGHEEVACSIDSLLVPERAIKSLAEGNADVFDGVVLIDVEVALAGEFEIEAAVPREQLEHVIEESYAGGDLVLARAFDGEREIDLRLRGMAS